MMEERFLKEFGYNERVLEEYKEIISPILEDFPISHVWVSKFYHDGRYIDLSSDLEWKKAAIEVGSYDELDGLWSQTRNNKSASYCQPIWTADLQEGSPTEKVVKKHGITTFHNIYYHHNDHVVNFGFALTLETDENDFFLSISSPEITKFIQSHHNTFLMICRYLQNATEHLLNPTEDVYGRSKCTNLSVDGQLGENTLNDLFIPKRVPLGNGYVTQSEIVHISYMAAGKSLKEIASLLNISPRTVEQSISSAKTRTECFSKWELVGKYLQDPLLRNLDPDYLANCLLGPKKNTFDLASGE